MAEAKLEQRVLDVVGSAGTIAESAAFAAAEGVDHLTLVGVLKSLETAEYVVLEPITTPTLGLTEEGEGYLRDGTPEVQVYRQVPADGFAVMNDLKKRLGKMFGIGWGRCMKNRWLKLDKASGQITRLVPEVNDAVREQLQQIADGTELGKKEMKELKRRQLVSAGTRTTWKVSKGAEYQPKRVRLATDLTKDMLKGDAWKTAELKEYNWGSRAKELPKGSLHMLMKVRAEFRSVLLEMGFQEMPTAKFVESSFWNFDSLFQPQSHPARDAHDTFFLTKPKHTLRLPEDYVARVKDIHENGGHGSIGYGCKWKRSDADANLLRTHTTAVSAQMLYRVAQQKEFKPIRLFSIDRVFRNETMDATHLAEFHQVEGVVADYNLSLGDLIGVITEFFRSIGIKKLRFKPAYNPYTEPSMEVFGYHPQLKKWTEIGNSGIFRPEMLRPMGLPENVRVIAWGLSLERPTMIRYKIDNIRTLFGDKVQVPKTKRAPICRFDGGDVGRSYSGATRAEGSGRPDTL